MELSPQYVPAEKFEEERRALYASLLKPDSPVVQDDSATVTESTVPLNESTESTKPEPKVPVEQIDNETAEGALNRSVEDAMAELHGDETLNSNDELDGNNAVSEKTG